MPIFNRAVELVDLWALSDLSQVGRETNRISTSIYYPIFSYCILFPLMDLNRESGLTTICRGIYKF